MTRREITRGRGSREDIDGELEGVFAFASMPSMQYVANSVWQVLSVFDFNLAHSFELVTTIRRDPVSRSRRTLFGFETIHTLRRVR